jgi:drug/metabolite transporter (DMT)-like permease
MTNRQKVTVGSLCVSLAAIMWGFDGVVLTPRLFNLDVSYVVFILHALPFVVMNLILFREYRVLKTLTPNDVLYMFLIALFGGALGTLAIVKALFLVQFQQLTVVALLQKLQPIFAILLARIILHEKLGRNFLLWTAVALLGGYFLTFQLHVPTLVNSGNMLPAAVYALFAAFAFGSATVFGKRVLNKIPFQAALFFRYGMTALIMGGVLLLNGKFSQFPLTTTMNWTIFVITGITTGSGAILLYYYGLRHISATVSTICELCFPIATVIFDYVFNKNVLSPIQWVSAALMLVAIYRISMNQRGDMTEVQKPSALYEVSG